VYFVFDEMSITGLEQNPETKSNWARMARTGIKVMQFIHHGIYVAVITARKVTLYEKRTA
jgi:3-deoxy-D-manno-octulosonate 8-phosphate phosphatase KdsC-like HAD superfamily phosphatase